MSSAPRSEADGVPERRSGSRRRRLSTRLVLLMIALLGIACLVIGIASHLAMRASLHSQTEAQLTEASHRATSFAGPAAGGGEGGVVPGQGEDPDATAPPNPLEAPGQGAGTLNARVVDGQFRYAGVLDADGDALALGEADREALRQVQVGAPAQELTLEQGAYLTVAETDAAGETVITGVPLEQMHRTLRALTTVMILVSAAALTLVGLLGSVVIRRTMKPLERVSEVATDVSRLDLGSAPLPEQARVRPEDAEAGTEVGAVGHALNLLLENVRRALAARQRSEDAMRDFVADASHELRTPLAAIRGYADLMRWTEQLSEQGQNSLGRIDAQSQRMAALVEDLLLLARLDEGRQAEPQEVDLTELVLESVSDLQVAAPSHHWALELPEEPVTAFGDEAQLRRVLLNLLSNARKHTDEGTLVTTGLALSPDGREAVLTVTDDGPGIAPDFLPKIFSRFARADAARSGSAGTTGLGLAIVKAIVEHHGGEISVTSTRGGGSEPGEAESGASGTRFEVRLPTGPR